MLKKKHDSEYLTALSAAGGHFVQPKEGKAVVCSGGDLGNK